MTAKRLFLVLIISAVSAVFAQWDSIKNRHENIHQLATIACDIVSARAQAGSTRDVHDQLYSFWHKHSTGLPVEILVRRGEKEVGAHASLNRSSIYTQSCQIENRPDYEISFQFQDEAILSPSLIEKLAAAFMFILSMYVVLSFVLRQMRALWFGQVLREIRVSLGLENEPTIKSSLFSRFLAKVFLNSASNIKPDVEKLQKSLAQKQSELIQRNNLVSKLEEEKIRADKFANMVAMVRHDLKGPLSALKITAGGIKDLPDESVAIRHTIISIEKIISDLDQNKNIKTVTSKDNLEIEIAEVAIQDVVHEKSGTLARRSNIKIEFEYNQEKLSPIMCEPNYLRRVIANLIQNAIEASPASSVVRVGVRHLKGHILIEIADQGSGIAPEILPRLFERGATFGKISGTGEGLSFVKTKTESFGGFVSIAESSPKGTVFQLKLPLVTMKAHFRAMPSEVSFDKMAILDDEIEFQKLAWAETPGQRKYFNTPHALLSWIESTPEALEFSRLVDLHLGDLISGVDVIRMLGNNSNTYLATSDYLNPKALEISSELGIGIIPKSLLFAACRSR